jgi:hypothetical protein
MPKHTGVYHANQIPKEVLKQMLAVYNTDRKRLTQIEIDLCKRIALCCHCSNVWLMHRGKTPRRCEKCKRTQWNAPLLTQMIAATVDASTAQTGGT